MVNRLPKSITVPSLVNTWLFIADNLNIGIYRLVSYAIICTLIRCQAKCKVGRYYSSIYFQASKSVWQRFRSPSKGNQPTQDDEECLVQGEFYLTDALTNGRSEREQRTKGTNSTLLLKQKHRKWKLDIAGWGVVGSLCVWEWVKDR